MSLAELIWLLAPPLCWVRGEPARGTDPLCRRCRLSLRWLPPEPVVVEPPAAPSAAGGPAGEAGAAGAPGIQAWAPVAYEGPARALVQGLKFGAAAGLAETMAAQIVACAP